MGLRGVPAVGHADRWAVTAATMTGAVMTPQLPVPTQLATLVLQESKRPGGFAWDSPNSQILSFLDFSDASSS